MLKLTWKNTISLSLANLVNGLVNGCAAWREHQWVKLLVVGVIDEINPSRHELQGVVLPLCDDRVHPRARHRDRPAAPTLHLTRHPLGQAHRGPPDPAGAGLPAQGRRPTPTWPAGPPIGTSTVYRYLREAIGLLAATTPTLAQAIEVAARKAFVIGDGTLLRIDRAGMGSDRDRV